MSWLPSQPGAPLRLVGGHAGNDRLLRLTVLFALLPFLAAGQSSWDRSYLSETPSFREQPNAFLVSAVE